MARKSKYGRPAQKTHYNYVKTSEEVDKIIGLSSSAKRVHARLLWHARGWWVAWPSIATLADSLALSKRTINNAIAELKNVGLITKTDKGKTGKATTYYLLEITKETVFPPVEKKPKEEQVADESFDEFETQDFPEADANISIFKPREETKAAFR